LEESGFVSTGVILKQENTNNILYISLKYPKYAKGLLDQWMSWRGSSSYVLPPSQGILKEINPGLGNK